MGNLLYIIVVVLVILWALGYFAFAVGSFIHILIVIAVIIILIKLLTGNKVIK